MYDLRYINIDHFIAPLFVETRAHNEKVYPYIVVNKCVYTTLIE